MHRYRRISFALCTLLLVSFTLVGCSAKVVSVTEEKEFLLMTKRFAQMLYAQQILDTDGQYVEPLMPIAQALDLSDDLGVQFYIRLSPVFYSQGINSNQHVSILPQSFAAIKQATDSVQFFPQGFVLTQKTDTIALQLLATTDWNGDGNDDYILLARVKSNKKGIVRDYYLVIEDIEAPSFTGQVVGTYDYKTKVTKAYSARETVSYENSTIEVEAGIRPVVLPRDTATRKKDKSETALSE